MTATLTLKNIPDSLYERLKASADLHRRSMNSEAIVCLKTVSMPASPTARLARARELRAALVAMEFPVHEIDTLKRKGRE